MSVELRRKERCAFEYYSNVAQVVRDLERDLARCGGFAINGEPAFKVIVPRLEQARLAKAEAYADWQRAKAVTPTSRPVKLAKRAPVTLPRSTPRITPAQREAMQRQAHAALDAMAWRLSGLK